MLYFKTAGSYHFANDIINMTCWKNTLGNILFCCCLSAVITLFSIAHAVIQPVADQTLVRVGFYENPPKIFNSQNNIPKGIFPEIIEHIAEKENWRIEWVKGTWEEGLSRLESGTIDMMPDVAYSLKRAEKYSFSDEPVFINWAVLYTRTGLRINSILDLAGKKIAVMRGSIHTEGQEGIRNQANKFNISCEFIEFDNYAGVFLALQNNLADVGVVNRLYGDTSGKLYDVLPTTVVFNPRHIKFAFPPTGQKTSTLKKAVDYHLRAARSQPESLIPRIIRSHLSGIPLDQENENNKGEVFLTAEEREWIKAHPTIRIGIDPEFAPFEFIDNYDKYSGYASDYIRLLNQRLGLHMEVVKGLSWTQAISGAEQGAIDVLASVGFTSERSRYLLYTSPYMGFYRMIFCRAEAPFISNINDIRHLKVAVQAKSSHAGWIQDNTNLEAEHYDSLEEAIKAVSDGKSDVLIGNLAACTYWIRKLNITNLRIAAPVSLERQLLHMAVRKDWPKLVNILNKGLASISSQEAEVIRNRWTAAGYSVGVSSRLVWKRIGLVISLALLFIGFFWYWNHRLHNEVKLRKQAEQALLNSHKQLAERVRERTRELAEANVSLQQEMKKKQELQERLHRSEKMKAIGLMAGGVAHDLNNILAGIVSYPDLLLVKLPQDSPLRKHIQVIKDTGRRAAAVVSDLLTVARGVAHEKQPININTLIHEYLSSPEYMELQARFSDIRYTTDLAPDLNNISCSPIHIKKCLMNLITNAAEAMVHSGTITLATRNEENPTTQDDSQSDLKRRVALTVSDTGPGIAEKDIDHIFEPFYSKKVMGRSGTGLGLAVVWNTMQDHDGYILVTSSDTGSEFVLMFPETGEKEADPPTNILASDMKGQGETILVVDDEAQQRDVTCSMLGSMGYTVDSVNSGEEAVNYLQTWEVDLIVLDMIMEPGMSGLTAYENILRLSPGQKAIIVSGFSENDEVKKARQMGAEIFVKKPFTYIELGSAVKKTLHIG